MASLVGSNQLATSQVGVTDAAAVLLCASRPGRHQVVLSIPDSADATVFLGGPTVTALTGGALFPGTALVFSTQTAIYGITAAAGTATIAVFDEYDT